MNNTLFSFFRRLHSLSVYPLERPDLSEISTNEEIDRDKEGLGDSMNIEQDKDISLLEVIRFLIILIISVSAIC